MSMIIFHLYLLIGVQPEKRLRMWWARRRKCVRLKGTLNNLQMLLFAPLTKSPAALLGMPFIFKVA